MNQLKSTIEAQTEEAEEWRNKHLNLEIQRAQEIEILRQQFEAFKRSNIVIWILSLQSNLP
mgnify:CR=1 FL=1